MLENAFNINCEIVDDACHEIKSHGFSKERFELMSQALDNMKDVIKICNGGYKDDMHMMHTRASFDGAKGKWHNDKIMSAIDDIRNMYESYVDAKEMYMSSKMDTHKRNMLDYLSKMLDAHRIAMLELQKCTDCDDERVLITNKTRLER